MAKSPRLDLFEKLSELKAWQSKQQEKLLVQQKEQQSIPKTQQKQEMDLFESQKIEIVGTQNRSAAIRGQLDDLNWRYHDETAIRNQDTGRANEDINMGNKWGNVSLDDLPVKSPNLQFEELLEEKLKDIGNNVAEGRNNAKPKRQFLRKGEGLKRFRMNSHNEFMKTKPAIKSNEPQICSRKCNTSATSSIQSRNSANSSIKASNSKFKASEVIPAKEQSILGLNVKPASKYSESMTWSHMLNQEQQGCSTKVEKMHKHEAEDLKVFELLEQMAVDSSFCSTSSTLLGFMESPIISTPLKAILEHRKQLKDLKSPKHLPFGMDVSDEDTDDDFASSSESYSSGNETKDDKVNDAAQSSSRVRFSSLVEEREFDPGIEKLSIKSCTIDDFKDTEVWSDSDDDGNDEESTKVTELNEPTDNPLASEKQDEIRASPLSEKDNFTTPGMSSNENQHRNAHSSEIILKSELLHRKLLELEQEIQTFRKENEELSRRNQLQQQAEEKWQKEKTEIEKKLILKEEELKQKALEERQKLNREKKVFETYSKKISDKPSNHQEVEILQKKLAELHLEFREKERKNTAAYNRISNRVKVLEKENTELKEEIDKLKKEKQVESKKSAGRLVVKKKIVGNTKALHQINEDLTRMPLVTVLKSKPALNKEPVNASEEKRESEVAEMECYDETGISLLRMQRVPNILNKSHCDFSPDDKHAQSFKDTGGKLKDISEKHGSELALADRSSVIPKAPIGLREETDCQLMGRQSLKAGIEATNCAINSLNQIPRASTAFPSEKTNPDGSREIRYENGNFKKISPDGLNVKLFYFNGDVKETLSDGTIKYYYSETRTWHTTFLDGLEILEFPNGQVERHFQRTVEVAFPDGTVRIIQADGKEELKLPDGTHVITDNNGDKIISFPNGQKEYQTNDFKKRIYPDGTMKIVYSDGVQETRYSNGRVRLRDAAGSLLMDSSES